mmetsp:Transcript_8795/g.26329  ORF Transcript_8795/g.26329 Transcript_8795/m.26329 type:complete len:379 (+) Transcript_8795:1790-2926(+)
MSPSMGKFGVARRGEGVEEHDDLRRWCFLAGDARLTIALPSKSSPSSSDMRSELPPLLLLLLRARWEPLLPLLFLLFRARLEPLPPLLLLLFRVQELPPLPLLLIISAWCASSSSANSNSFPSSTSSSTFIVGSSPWSIVFSICANSDTAPFSSTSRCISLRSPSVLACFCSSWGSFCCIDARTCSRLCRADNIALLLSLTTITTAMASGRGWSLHRSSWARRAAESKPRLRPEHPSSLSSPLLPRSLPSPSASSLGLSPSQSSSLLPSSLSADISPPPSMLYSLVVLELISLISPSSRPIPTLASPHDRVRSLLPLGVTGSCCSSLELLELSSSMSFSLDSEDMYELCSEKSDSIDLRDPWDRRDAREPWEVLDPKD